MFNESFWLAICVIGFVLVVYRPIKSFLLLFLDNRIQTLHLQLQKYQTQNQHAHEMLAKVNSHLAQTQRHHQEILNNAKAEAAQLQKTKNAELIHLLAIRRTEFEHILLARATQAQKDIYAQMTKSSIELVKQYFGAYPENLPTNKEIVTKLYFNSKPSV